MPADAVLSFNRQATFEVTRYSHSFGPGLETVHVELTCKAGEGPHKPPHDTWAIRWMGRCWNGHEWEFEPLPSGRDDDFLRRTRWANGDELLFQARRAVKTLSDESGMTRG